MQQAYRKLCASVKLTVVPFNVIKILTFKKSTLSCTTRNLIYFKSFMGTSYPALYV